MTALPPPPVPFKAPTPERPPAPPAYDQPYRAMSTRVKLVILLCLAMGFALLMAFEPQVLAVYLS